MVQKSSPGRMLFQFANYSLLAIIAAVCCLPLIHIAAISFSSSSAATAGLVNVWPVDFTTMAYQYTLSKSEFLTSFLVALERIAIGVPLAMLLTVLVAFPLSKESRHFRFRSVYVWYFVVTILFNGGLIPFYVLLKELHLLDTIWALTLPAAVPVFNVILLLNFMRGLPRELSEAAYIDGAGHWSTLWKVIFPLSKPVLATVLLFTCVTHWNSWFDGLILMNDPHNYPLQSYLQTVIINQDPRFMTVSELKVLSEVSNRTAKAAQTLVAALPILLVYPFLQRFFISGIVLGSVKG
ncbi:carbohydrate ABC transporter permease [Cohnella silvisoli]|uniref:Carbohydrate ABC transporter permease n=1 Tax=Cohnella silvisoli TaxID=2873699 RepID=A0ABV1KRV6_9BACL|nr:carbohydrate ABC transporter permease [Cohnella silvisoli]MCD9022537.1 carbohydrate ABC transporter permease [Cohnella silvisoli]